MKTMTSTLSLTGTPASARALQTTGGRKRKASLSSKVFGCISALVFTFASLAASAVAITGASLTTTAGALTATTSCVNGYWAPGWTGTPVKLWKWQVSTTGYENIVFNTPTNSSATGPHSAQFQWSTDNVNWNAMTTLNWSGTGCTGTGNLSLPSGANNQATLYVRALMTGATASGGTSRMSIQAFSGDLIPSACTGAPTAGTISAGSSSFCGSGSTTLTLSGATAGVGITYQWQSSPAGAGTWSNVGTSSTTYNTGTVSASTDYRVQVTCSTGPTTSTTSTFAVTVNALPTVGTLSFASGSNPFQVGDAIDIDPSVPGGTFSSNNINAFDVDATTGAGDADFGGTAVVTYTIVDGMTLCSNSVTQNVDIVWPNTLALYAGINGSSTSVLPGDVNVVTNTLTATGFGSNSPCGSGGLSGLTVNTSITSFANGNPHVYYKINPTAGNALNVFQIHARARVSGTGPTKARLAYSFDGINWIPDAEVNLTSGSCGASANNWYWTVGGPTITGITGDFYVAVFPYSPGANSGTFQLNTLEVYGEVSSDDPCTGGTLDMGELIAISGNTNVCGSGSRMLEFLHQGGVGISYQYEYSTDGGANWNITSAADTNIFFNTGTITATTMYRVVVTCAFGGSVTSTPLTITVTPDQPHDAISGPDTYFVDGLEDFTTVFTNAGLTPDSVKWVSSYVSTADIDASGVVGNFNFPANDVRITRVKYVGGCATATTDTIDIVHECAIAYYLGENGTSVDVTDVQNVTSSDVASTGFGTGTNCSTGGKSGMNNAPASFSTSGAHISYETTNNEDVMAVSGLHATVRISSTGPVYARLAYRVHDGITWGSWIDEGADHEITPDDCGYSNDEIHWCEAGAGALSLPVLTSGQKIEVAVFPHAPSTSGGTFQLNSMTICGTVADLCAGEPQSTEILDASDDNIANTTLPVGANALHLNGTVPAATYWTIGGVTNEAYFGCATTGGNTGVLNVVDDICNVTITAYGFRPAGACFTKVEATNVDLIDECGGKSTGVATTANNVNVSFFPNPATNVVNVTATENVNVSVTGIDGKVLIEEKNAKNINVSNLATGVYFIQAFDMNNNLLKTEKLIKQ